MYKGQDLSKEGMGYANIATARKYMDEWPIRKDFDATLPENYWYDYQLVRYAADTMNHQHMIGQTMVHDSDFDRGNLYLKDLPDGKAKELYNRLFEIHKTKWQKRSEAQQREADEIGLQLDKLGWYCDLIDQDTDDYWKRYRKYKKQHLSFVEKEVQITVT